MKIGIFLNYAPGVKLTTEGLGRYLGTLVKGFQEAENEIVIACPRWLLPSMQDLEKDLKISGEGIQWITTDTVPPVWKVYQLVTRKKKPARKKKRWEALYQRHMLRMAECNSWPGLLAEGIVLVFFSVIGGAAMAVGKLANDLSRLIKRGFKKIVGRIDRKKKEEISRSMFQRMQERSAEILVDRINHYKPMDLWYVPALFWPEVNQIANGRVVINAPDLVTQKFPVGFAELVDEKQTEDCRKTIEEGRYFITYCDYIGSELIQKQYGGRGKKVYSILHSNHDLLPYIQIPQDVSKQMNLGKEKDLTLEFSKSVLAGIRVRSNVVNGYQLANTRYLFYATQFRPNKNLMTLLKAFRILTQRKFQHLRLVLTCNPDVSEELRNYLDRYDLWGDVVFCVGVSSQELAALYRCAELSVTTTLYEGGFPFTFGEGMSVGTPSIMSDIPQIREILEPEGLETAMFHATDTDDLVQKILWALENRDKLYQRELPLYEKLAKRTDKVVAEEYMQVFDSILSA